MFRCTIQQGLAVILLGAGFIAGCKSTGKDEAYPPDPLLMSKKPVDGMMVTGPNGELLASAEPATPRMPAIGYAANPGGQPPTMLIPNNRGPLVATPAVRSRPTPEPVPFAGRKVEGTYGHAPDYTWLQGVLDKHYHGHMDLRYCDHTVEDAYGGKVCLEDDPRLAQFQEGDTVVVEGVLQPDTQQGKGIWKSNPHFRVYNVWLVQRKK